jgi:hypothetical protein
MAFSKYGDPALHSIIGNFLTISSIAMLSMKMSGGGNQRLISTLLHEEFVLKKYVWKQSKMAKDSLMF